MDRTYLVTLRVTPDPGHAPPDRWNWARLVQTKRPPVVVSVIEETANVLPLTRRAPDG